MILVDRALERRQREGKPVRVAMVGAGFMARGIALHIARYVQGMELVCVVNRTAANAVRACDEASLAWEAVDSARALEHAMGNGRCGVTQDYRVACEADGIDAVVEVTGNVEYGAHVTLSAIANGKHIILMNAELDGTLGPLLKRKADAAGLVYTNADGDQPGVTMNLFRFVKGLGVQPVLCGNIKGLQDAYRNPTTQEGFAKKWGQNPYMVTSFADGTKISFEQALVANATGMRVGRRGMYGPVVEPGTPVTKASEWYPEEALREGEGIVDYVVGASPGPGVFVLGTHDHPRMRHYLDLYKIEGKPYYCFHTPYHLCHFEVPNTIARAVLFGDAAIAPDHGMRVEVVATAKVSMEAGEELDAIGGYKTYGQCENYPVSRREDLLPMGLAEGCRLRRSLRKDEVLRRADVDLPEGRLCDRLRLEQDALFPPDN